MATMTRPRRVRVSSQRDELILKHLWLVKHIVGRILAQLPPGVDRENLEAAGALGLVEAARNFEARRGIKFKTFAYIRIRGATLDELRRNCPLPQQMVQRVNRLRQAAAGLPGPVSVEMLSEATGLTPDEVCDGLSAMQLTQVLSWEASGPAADCPGSRDLPVTEAIEQAEQRERLARLIEGLPERERLVVTLYYLEELRLREVGAVLGLSESRVSRILSAALLRLQQALGQADNREAA